LLIGGARGGGAARARGRRRRRRGGARARGRVAARTFRGAVVVVPRRP
jgi:hypothetical protein